MFENKFLSIPIFLFALLFSEPILAENFSKKEMERIPNNYVYVVDHNTSRPISKKMLTWLGNEWDIFKTFVDSIKIYPITSNSMNPIMYIIAIDFNKIDLKSDVNPPKPIIVNHIGKKIATLPQHYPYEDAWELQIIFRSWRNNWPHYIDLYIYDAAVGPDHSIKGMDWDYNKKKYVSEK